MQDTQAPAERTSQPSPGIVPLVVALVLACNPRCLPRLRLVFLLRPLQQRLLGRRLRLGSTTSRPIRQAHDPLLHRQVVRSLSNHETQRLGG